MPDPLFQARRTRVALLAAAAVAVVAASGGVALTRLDGAPAPTPTTPPPTTGALTPPAATGPITDQQLLRPEDVGEGYRVATGGGGSGDWTFEASASLLGCPPGDGPPEPVDKHQRSLVRGSPRADDVVIQSVARHRPGDAARYLDQVRARVAACRPGPRRSISVARHGFAGDQALLVAVYHGGGASTNHLLVRQGDLLTEILVKPDRSRPVLQRLGRTAAERLCDGGRAC